MNMPSSVYDTIFQTVNNITNNKIYTHGMQGFMGYIKQSLLQFYQHLMYYYICHTNYKELT